MKIAWKIILSQELGAILRQKKIRNYFDSFNFHVSKLSFIQSCIKIIIKSERLGMKIIL